MRYAIQRMAALGMLLPKRVAGESHSLGLAFCSIFLDPVSHITSALFGISCGLGLLSSQYNRGSFALAEQTACRIDDLMAKIGH
jgi:hypothetical protein